MQPSMLVRLLHSKQSHVLSNFWKRLPELYQDSPVLARPASGRSSIPSMVVNPLQNNSMFHKHENT